MLMSLDEDMTGSKDPTTSGHTQDKTSGLSYECAQNRDRVSILTSTSTNASSNVQNLLPDSRRGITLGVHTTVPLQCTPNVWTCPRASALISMPSMRCPPGRWGAWARWVGLMTSAEPLAHHILGTAAFRERSRGGPCQRGLANRCRGTTMITVAIMLRGHASSV